ncbi:hypothetical protein ACWGI8_00760 [Streptomyces sp. NPDC054841]
MSEPQGTSTSTSAGRRGKTAALSGHWKIAVLAAAGFAIVGATTAAAATGDGFAEAKPASATKDDGKAGMSSAAAGSTRDGMDADGGDGDYWAGHAGNPGESSGDKEDDDHSDSGDKSDSGGKDDNGGKEKDSASKGNEGKEKESEDHDKEKGGHDRDHGRGSYEGDHEKAVDVECDPNDLISAIAQANELEGPSHLRLAEKCTYTLTAFEDGNGLPKITQPITIEGNGATIARAANAAQFRVFEVGVGGDLKLRNLTITRGKADDDNGGGINVNPAGRVDIEKVTLENNTVSDVSSYEGGGVYTEGITNIRNSTLDKNSGHEGAAVSNYYGKVDISTTKVTNNISDGYAAIVNEYGTTKISKSYLAYNYGYYGGALNSYDGVTEVEKSAIANNFGYYGGGIYHEYGSLYVRKSTIKANTASDGGGGGLNLEEPAVIEDSKIIDNATTNSNGGGIYIYAFDEVAIRDSKVAGNRAPGNGSTGGGIYVDSFATLTLTDSKVKDNTSDEPAGGIENNGTVTTKGKVKIIDNVPTNCDSPTSNPVPSCFG